MHKKIRSFLADQGLFPEATTSIATGKQTIIIAILSLAWVFVGIIILPLSFSSNDDVIMNSIASGMATGAPSHTLIFTHAGIGYLLKALYSLAPAINWYTCYLLASYALAFWGLQHALGQLPGSLPIKATRFVALTMVLLPALLHIQFTQIAAMVILAGIVLIALSRNKLTACLLGGMCIVWGSMIRPEVLYLYGLIALPFGIYGVLRPPLRLRSIILGLAFIMSLLAIACNNYSYNRHEDWKSYREFNRLRSRITTSDNPSFTYPNVKSLVEKHGWSQNDFLVASNFNLDAGLEKFATATLKDIVHEFQLHVVPGASAQNDFFKAASTIKWFMTDKTYFLVYAMFLLLFLDKNHRKPLLAMAFFLYMVLIAFILIHYFNGHLKDRVAFGLMLPWKIGVIMLFDPETLKSGAKETWQKVSKGVAYGFLGLALFTLSMHLLKYTHTRSDRQKAIARDQALYDFIQNYHKGFYVSWLDLVHYPVFQNPYKQSEAYLPGWLAASPINRAKLPQHPHTSPIGLYDLHDTSLSWFFNSSRTYTQAWPEYIFRFYQENFPLATLEKFTHPIHTGDTIWEIRVHLP